jgi:hypothetical protein
MPTAALTIVREAMKDEVDEKKKRPTNGETNGDDADIYAKAAATEIIRLAVASSVSIERLREVVELAREAVGILQTVRSTTKTRDLF